MKERSPTKGCHAMIDAIAIRGRFERAMMMAGIRHRRRRDIEVDDLGRLAFLFLFAITRFRGHLGFPSILTSSFLLSLLTEIAPRFVSGARESQID